jgi:hypothetical protein
VRAGAGPSMDVSLMTGDELAEYEDRKLKMRKVGRAYNVTGPAAPVGLQCVAWAAAGPAASRASRVARWACSAATAGGQPAQMAGWAGCQQ